jgi:hypothetical protein
MAEGLAKHLEGKGLREGAQRLSEALQKAKPDADEAALQVGGDRHPGAACNRLLHCAGKAR